jgi:hypothetical protein
MCSTQDSSSLASSGLTVESTGDTSATMGGKRAAAGKGCDPAAVSKMLGLLKYNADKGKDQEKKDAALTALNVYKALADADERAQFLQDFASSGGGKTAASLKFAVQFRKSVENKKVTETSATENFYTRLFFTVSSLVCRCVACAISVVCILLINDVVVL